MKRAGVVIRTCADKPAIPNVVMKEGRVRSHIVAVDLSAVSSD
jgi:hypothetical protein